MSVLIKGTTIIMTRGDTLRTKIIITDALGNEYIPVDGDKIKFAAKKDYQDLEVAINKDIPWDSCELHLAPEDTKELDQPQDYRYEVEITFANGDVDTFLKGILKLTEEVD